MAFRELAEKLDLPDGATERYRKLEALGRMLTGELYEDLPFSFEDEKVAGRSHITIRERRPSVEYGLAHEITQDTSAELWGDEQFPTLKALSERREIEDASAEVAAMLDVYDVAGNIIEAYEEGVIGGVGVVIYRSDNGDPFYEVIPAKWCEPVYRSQFSMELIALVVTYPIDREAAEELFPGISDEDDNKGAETFWYRYVVGPVSIVDYRPLPDAKFARLGQKNKDGETIEFTQSEVKSHGFKGRTPALYAKNLRGKKRDLDGPALWWPIRDICVEIDYTLSQAGRGLRYSADPMLFVNKGDILNSAMNPIGYEKPAGGMATVLGDGGEMVKGVTQTLVGAGAHADAKLLEISAQAIKEEREFVRDLREYALEVIGGMRARAEQQNGPASGAAIDKSTKPLRRLVRRQRVAYGRPLLLDLVDLTLYGIRIGALEPSKEFDINAIPVDARFALDWPTDDVLQGQDLLYHTQAMQMAAGGSPTNPIELLKPEAAGAKLAADIGMHQPYDTIKGTLEPHQAADPEQPPVIVKP